MKKPVFKGCATALITPFTHDTVDYAAFRRLIDYQLEAGINALVICGTTGEAATMSYAEKMRTLETAVRHVDGRVPIIAGTGANSTETAIALSRDAERIGADALLVVTPYYNKATQAGLIRHYEAIANSVEKPVILYNVPARTGVSCTAETYAALSAHPNIVGVKEASGNLSLVQKTRELCPDDFYVWSGNDDQVVPMMALGAKGVISVASNIIPEAMAELCRLCLEGDFAQASDLQIKYTGLFDVLFADVNPIQIKTAMNLLGMDAGELRLPLCAPSEANLERLKRELIQLESL